MNLQQAITLADELRAEAAYEDITNIDYSPIQAASTDEWAVKSTDTSNMEALELWISPELSFPL